MNKKPKIALISLFNTDFGIRYISSLLNSKGYSTDIISFGQLRITQEIPRNNYILSRPLRHKACPDKDVDLLINLLLNLRPDFIGISVPSTSFITAKILTQRIKKRFDVTVIWGGIHPTLCPEECLPYADIVCIGEGEYPMLELARRLEGNEEITSIKNLWIKRKDGSVERNDLRDLIQNLDSLPFPDFVSFGNKFLIDRGRLIADSIIISAFMKNEYPIMSSRGCHNSCSYCCNRVLKVIYKDKGHYVRRRTPENVIDELVCVRENREIAQIRFWDDIFTYDQNWIEKFCQLYIKKVALSFTCYTHPKYTDKRIIQMLTKAGLVRVDIGVQSGSESLCQNRLKRYQSNEEIIEFANLLKKLGVLPRYEIILDNPYESDYDSDATAELLLRLPRPYIGGLHSLCYFPKTELTNQALEDKLITEEDIEGKDNKALNNYYMCIDLVKNKKYLFRDIITAMIVSDFFSDKLIRKCKYSRFIRRHPKLLLIILRLYLKISVISPRAILKIFRRTEESINQAKKLFRKNPRFFLALAKLYLKLEGLWRDKSKFFTYCNFIPNDCYYHIMDTPDYSLEDQTKIDLVLFPKDIPKSICKSFYLKIKQKGLIRYPLPLNLLIQMYPLMFNQPRNRLALWEIDLEMNSDQMEMEVDLSFPHLLFKLDGIRKEASTRGIKRLLENGIYVIYLLLYDVSQKRYIFKNSINIYLDEK